MEKKTNGLSLERRNLLKTFFFSYSPPTRHLPQRGIINAPYWAGASGAGAGQVQEVEGMVHRESCWEDPLSLGGELGPGKPCSSITVAKRTRGGKCTLAWGFGTGLGDITVSSSPALPGIAPAHNRPHTHLPTWARPFST